MRQIVIACMVMMDLLSKITRMSQRGHLEELYNCMIESIAQGSEGKTGLLGRVDTSYRTFMSRVCMKGDYEMLFFLNTQKYKDRSLFSYFDIQSADMYGRTPLLEAISTHNAAFLDLLLNSVFENKHLQFTETPKTDSAALAEIMRMFQAKDASKRTALDYAASSEACLKIIANAVHKCNATLLELFIAAIVHTVKNSVHLTGLHVDVQLRQSAANFCNRTLHAIGSKIILSPSKLNNKWRVDHLILDAHLKDAATSLLLDQFFAPYQCEISNMYISPVSLATGRKQAVNLTFPLFVPDGNVESVKAFIFANVDEMTATKLAQELTFNEAFLNAISATTLIIEFSGTSRNSVTTESIRGDSVQGATAASSELGHIDDMGSVVAAKDPLDVAERLVTAPEGQGDNAPSVSEKSATSCRLDTAEVGKEMPSNLFNSVSDTFASSASSEVRGEKRVVRSGFSASIQQLDFIQNPFREEDILQSVKTFLSKS